MSSFIPSSCCYSSSWGIILKQPRPSRRPSCRCMQILLLLWMSPSNAFARNINHHFQIFLLSSLRDDGSFLLSPVPAAWFRVKWQDNRSNDNRVPLHSSSRRSRRTDGRNVCNSLRWRVLLSTRRPNEEGTSTAEEWSSGCGGKSKKASKVTLHLTVACWLYEIPEIPPEPHKDGGGRRWRPVKIGIDHRVRERVIKPSLDCQAGRSKNVFMNAVVVVAVWPAISHGMECKSNEKCGHESIIKRRRRCFSTHRQSHN